MNGPTEDEIAAAAAWLADDDTAYTLDPDAALRAAAEMLKAAWRVRVTEEKPIKRRIPAEVFHPSLFILDEMEERGWSRDDLVTHMTMCVDEDWDITRLALDLYLKVGPKDDKICIGDELAAQLARAFGTPVQFWLNLEKSWTRN